jgi:hypothetical protein
MNFFKRHFKGLDESPVEYQKRYKIIPVPKGRYLLKESYRHAPKNYKPSIHWGNIGEYKTVEDAMAEIKHLNQPTIALDKEANVIMRGANG